jgi:uncharacterized coiled-coil DUF342 family protein
MGVTERIWGALTSMIKLEEKITRQSEAIRNQQIKIEDLTGRVIRLETALALGSVQSRGSSKPPAKQLPNKIKRVSPQSHA